MLNPWDFSGTFRLFVYGTLLTEETFVRVLGQRFTTVEEFAEPPRAGLCATRATLNDYVIAKPRGGRYPVAVHAAEKAIRGMVVFRLTHRQLVVLDAYEGPHYARTAVTVETLRGLLHAETYLGTSYLPGRGDRRGPGSDPVR